MWHATISGATERPPSLTGGFIAHAPGNRRKPALNSYNGCRSRAAPTPLRQCRSRTCAPRSPLRRRGGPACASTASAFAGTPALSIAAWRAAPIHATTGDADTGMPSPRATRPVCIAKHADCGRIASWLIVRGLGLGGRLPVKGMMKDHHPIRRSAGGADIASARDGPMPMTGPRRPGAAFAYRRPIAHHALAAFKTAGGHRGGGDPVPGPGHKRARVPGRAGHPTDA